MPHTCRYTQPARVPPAVPHGGFTLRHFHHAFPLTTDLPLPVSGPPQTTGPVTSGHAARPSPPPHTPPRNLTGYTAHYTPYLGWCRPHAADSLATTGNPRGGTCWGWEACKTLPSTHTRCLPGPAGACPQLHTCWTLPPHTPPQAAPPPTPPPQPLPRTCPGTCFPPFLPGTVLHVTALQFAVHRGHGTAFPTPRTRAHTDTTGMQDHGSDRGRDCRDRLRALLGRDQDYLTAQARCAFGTPKVRHWDIAAHRAHHHQCPLPPTPALCYWLWPFFLLFLGEPWVDITFLISILFSIHFSPPWLLPTASPAPGTSFSTLGRPLRPCAGPSRHSLPILWTPHLPQAAPAL